MRAQVVAAQLPEALPLLARHRHGSAKAVLRGTPVVAGGMQRSFEAVQLGQIADFAGRLHGGASVCHARQRGSDRRMSAADPAIP